MRPACHKWCHPIKDPSPPINRRATAPAKTETYVPRPSACPPHAPSHGHQRSIAVTLVICRWVPAGQHFAGQGHDRCPTFQAGHVGVIRVLTWEWYRRRAVTAGMLTHGGSP